MTDAFIGLFLEHPETKDKFFEFRDITIEDLKRSSDTQTSEFDPTEKKSEFDDISSVGRSGDLIIRAFW